MPDRWCRSHAQPDAAPTSVPAGALASLSLGGRLGQALSLTLQPNAVPVGIGAMSIRGLDRLRCHSLVEVLPSLGLGGCSDRGEGYAHAGQVLSRTPQAGLVPDSRRELPAQSAEARDA